MRILQVTLGFHPARAWGGPVQIVHQNGRELARRGHDVTVYCTNLLDKKHAIAPGTFEREVDGLRVRYFSTWRLPFWPGTLGPIWLPDLPATLASEIRTFDVVHLNGYRNLMLVPAAQAARRAGVPFVIQPHGAIPVIVNSLAVKRLYDRWLGRQELDGVSAVIVGQQSEREQALSLGIAPERIRIIPNGLASDGNAQPVPEAGSFRRRYRVPNDRLLILFLGRINRKKGVDMLVEAFARMRTRDTHLVIAGPDDGQLAEVTTLIERHDLGDRTTLTGLLSGSDVGAAYRDSDLFVLPCRTDTFPMAIVEACQAGMPMVVTDGCEIADLLRDRVASIVPFDPGDFAEAMDTLLEDRDLYARYRANCAELMRSTFSLSAAVDRLEALYAQVIAGHEGAAIG